MRPNGAQSIVSPSTILVTSHGSVRRTGSCGPSPIGGEADELVVVAPGSVLVYLGRHGPGETSEFGRRAVLNARAWLSTIGVKPAMSTRPTVLNAREIYTDPENGDVYVADGESRGRNTRIAVMDREGRFLRQWRPEGMAMVHCMTGARDGLVYVCNRYNSRLQVYDQRGRFIRNIEVPWRPYTPPSDGVARQTEGSAVSLALSRDPNETRMYVVNQDNARIEIIDRQTGRILSNFGGGVGHALGQFDQPHGIAVDSEGRVYVTENRGRRIQRFTIVR